MFFVGGQQVCTSVMRELHSSGNLRLTGKDVKTYMVNEWSSLSWFKWLLWMIQVVKMCASPSQVASGLGLLDGRYVYVFVTFRMVKSHGNRLSYDHERFAFDHAS